MIRRYKLGRDVELHKRTVERGAAVADRPGRARRRGRGGARPGRARQRRRARSAASRCGSSRPTSASTSSATPRAPRRSRPRCGVPEVAEAAAEVVRVERGRPRYGARPRRLRDPAGGRAQRARGLLQKGCYVGQETVARLLLPRQAEPPPARPAAVGARPRPASRCGSASARSGGRLVGRLARPRPDRARDRAPRGGARRHASVGDGGVTGDRRRAAVHLGGIDAARAGADVDPALERGVVLDARPARRATKPVIGLRPARPNSCTCGSRQAASVSSGSIRTTSSVVAHDADGHVAADHPAEAAEHLALDDARAGGYQLSDALGQLLVVGHGGTLRGGVISRAMAWHARVLVIANVTADSPELLAALQRARRDRGRSTPTLLMPATRNGFAGTRGGAGPARRGARAVARGRASTRDRRGRRPRSRGRRARDVGSARLRRGDRLDAAGPDARGGCSSTSPTASQQITGLDVTHVDGRRAARAALRPAAASGGRPARSARSRCARRRAADASAASARGSVPRRQLVHARLVRGEPQADDPRLVDLVGAQPAAELRPRRGAQRVGGARGELVGVLGQRAPVDDAAADDPERVARARRRSGARRARAASRRGSRAARRRAARAACACARGGAAARPRARSAARPRPRASGPRCGRAARRRRRGPGNRPSAASSRSR